MPLHKPLSPVQTIDIRSLTTLISSGTSLRQVYQISTVLLGIEVLP
jgi:hypothetical protein